MSIKCLRHTGNGRIFAWSEILSKRADMVPYDGELLPKPDESENQAPDQHDEGKPNIPNGTDPNKVFLILDAIKNLGPESFTKQGLPKVTKLSEVLGFLVTVEERDEAMAMQSKNNGDEA